MINGLEDLYEDHTGVRLPDWLLVHLSGLLGFVYVKNKNAPAPRMVFWGANQAKYQYETLADVVGFRWEMVTDHSFAFSLKRVKEFVDQGSAPILGTLDMYHLPYYEKFYHKIHVPIHHVLMVGYDDEAEAVFVLDCDRPEAQKVPYADLEQAWNVNIPGLGKKNTFYTFEFNAQVADVETIARKGIHKRSADMLHPPMSTLGLKGMQKLAAELARWPEQLTSAQLDACLRHLVEFTGFPPVPPSRLTGYADAPYSHAAGRDIFASLLRQLAQDYHEPGWASAAQHFDRSAAQLETLTDTICDYILGVTSSLETAAALIAEIAESETKGFSLLSATKFK
jgi:hypothetical protein